MPMAASAPCCFLEAELETDLGGQVCCLVWMERLPSPDTSNCCAWPHSGRQDIIEYPPSPSPTSRCHTLLLGLLQPHKPPPVPEIYQHTPVSGPLHLLFPPPAVLQTHCPAAYSLTSPRLLVTCPLITQDFPSGSVCCSNKQAPISHIQAQPVLTSHTQCISGVITWGL